MSLPASPRHPNHLKPLVIFGAGGHAVSVANVALSAGYQIMHFVDEQKKGTELLGLSIIGDLSELEQFDQYHFAIAVGDNAIRAQLYHNLSKTLSDENFPFIAHASAIVSSFTTIGAGTILMPNAVVGPNSNVGKFCIINTQASIDHDCKMCDFASLAPAAVTGGFVTIGVRSAISIGATIKHKISIGNDCVIGAHSFLNQNLPDNQVAYGTPAKMVRTRQIGDAYLK